MVFLHLPAQYSRAARRHPTTTPMARTRKMPPTLVSPSSLTEADSPSSCWQAPPPRSSFHHLSFSWAILRSSFSLMMAELIADRRGDPGERQKIASFKKADFLILPVYPEGERSRSSLCLAGLRSAAACSSSPPGTRSRWTP